MNIKNIIPFKNIYFIGIGGISMSGICEILISKNCFNISGSDTKSSSITQKLEEKGVNINYLQDGSSITDDIDLVVYTSAIKSDNKEIIKANSLNIKIMERSEFLGLLMKDYNYPLCVAGTHGKTTTSSMVSEVFLCAKKNPTISIGGILPTINSQVKVGDNNFFVLETCEYHDSFLKFSPHSAIILNIDLDHLDYFKDLEHIYSSFKKFAGIVKDDACLVINGDIKNYENITSDLKCSVYTYGASSYNDWMARNISYDTDGKATYDAYFRGEKVYAIKLSVSGEHNVYNSLSVCALCHFYNIDKKYIENGLSNFKGVARRFQYKGTFNGMDIVDDYAHHPTEIVATINTAKKKNINKLWCIFQPHTYTRTKALLDDFANALKDADNILITDIYSAREKDTGEVHAKDLVNKINKFGKKAIYIDSFDCGKDYIVENCQQGDLLITMGAGNIHLVGEMLLNK